MTDTITPTPELTEAENAELQARFLQDLELIHKAGSDAADLALSFPSIEMHGVPAEVAETLNRPTLVRFAAQALAQIAALDAGRIHFAEPTPTEPHDAADLIVVDAS